MTTLTHNATLHGQPGWFSRAESWLSKSCTRTSARRGLSAMRSTGNSAFDAYKADTLRRLEEEQHSFEDFLSRLRDAKDKAEFDQFMNERAAKADRDDQSEA